MKSSLFENLFLEEDFKRLKIYIKYKIDTLHSITTKKSKNKKCLIRVPKNKNHIENLIASDFTCLFWVLRRIAVERIKDL